jgi:hypothetical protein
MFGLFNKKNWRDSEAHNLLLSKFVGGSLPEYFINERWESVLKEKPEKALKTFISEEMLVPASLTRLLDYKFKTTELKVMLKERNLKSSGKKDELIDRLIQSERDKMLSAVKNLRMYECSPKGRNIAEIYMNKAKEKKVKAENEARNFLHSRNFEKAISVVFGYESSQVFPRGMGIDWKNYKGDRELESLKIIFGKIPNILAGINEQSLYPIRVAAGMMLLWGTATARHWLDENIETGIHLNPDASARMLIFYASHLNCLKRYTECAGIMRIKISGVDDPRSCSECRNIAGKEYRINEVPELPYPKCTSEMGCRCSTISVRV